MMFLRASARVRFLEKSCRKEEESQPRSAASGCLRRHRLPFTNSCCFSPPSTTMSASLAPECNEVKERYDTCFLKWYSEIVEFLRGTAKNDECEPLFKQYKECLGKALKERGIDQMLEEARADNRENDAEYMKPSPRGT
ncbi:hypothetical protein AC579_724 [Pseudocercospora musae]|uniref:Mitochondrial distribution and morphology protein 35 n=1 Tax=Pseudocercospora musae TaxID=113226 RepID=A0A139I9H1_9PEZI|nr:hypothetical protein AC579_724 [Pseudocercospora musae]KXT11374.1 hypothetical protein AC579_724 [Pseudocercospora musae]